MRLRIADTGTTTYRLEYSTNLANWYPCGDDAAIGAGGRFVDLFPPDTGCFYRAVPIVVASSGTNAWDQVVVRSLYGTDDRKDWYQETDSRKRAWANAVCALVDGESVVRNSNGSYSIQTTPFRFLDEDTGNYLPPCPDEPFANQPSAAYGTAFLVYSNLVVTAGHCFSPADLGRVKFVFGFKMLNTNQAATVVAANQIYEGLEIVAQSDESNLDRDFCVVRLDRAVTLPEVQPLEVRRDCTPALGTRIGAIGHPYGLPLKLAFGTQTTVRENESPDYFVANLGAYAGNSGSPVINADSGLVEGILVAGYPEDFESAGGCFRSAVLPDSEATEIVVKANTFAPYIPGANGVAALVVAPITRPSAVGLVTAVRGCKPRPTLLQALTPIPISVNPGETVTLRGKLLDRGTGKPIRKQDIKFGLGKTSDPILAVKKTDKRGVATFSVTAQLLSVSTKKQFINIKYWFAYDGLACRYKTAHALGSFTLVNPNYKGGGGPGAFASTPPRMVPIAGCIPTPLIPTSPTGAAISATATSLTLTWIRNSTNEAGFEIRRIAADGTDEEFGVGAGETSYVDDNLPTGVCYSYEVRAYNRYGYSAATSAGPNCTAACPLPAAPSSVTLSVSGRYLAATWKDNAANETGYRVAFHRSGGAQTTTYSLAPNTTSLVIGPLPSGACYWCETWATNACGESPRMSSTVTCLPMVPPSNVQTTATGNSMLLSWSENCPDELGFEIKRFRDGVADSTLLAGANATSLTDTGLLPGRYRYDVRASYLAGDSDWVPSPEAIVLPSAPQLRSPADGQTGVHRPTTFDWNDVQGATAYRLIVDYQPNDGSRSDRKRVEDVTVTSSTFTSQNLGPGRNYYWKVRAIHGTDVGPWSDEWHFATRTN